MAYLNIINLNVKYLPRRKLTGSILLFGSLLHSLVFAQGSESQLSTSVQSIMDSTDKTATSVLTTSDNINAPDNTQPDNVWRWLAENSALSHPVHKAIDQELDIYIKDIYWTGRNLKGAQPYLYYVIKQLQKRGLPPELALIPVIESGYNPRAQSENNAAGLWQFVPVTARGLGLKIGTWVDERKSVERSTEAALDYLEQMHSEFDDWSLAIAAYNAGPSRLRARIRKHGQEQFDLWDLPLPTETSRYVAKFFALNELVFNADIYELDLPEITPEEQFQRVNTDHQISVAVAADLAKIDAVKLGSFNHELETRSTPPDGPHSLLIPIAAVETFRENLQRAIADKVALYQPTLHHKVQYGETLGRIALNYKTTVRKLKELNKLENSNIRSGQKLLVAHYGPEPSKPKRKPRKLTPEYRVQAGDTLSEIAELYGITRSVIASSNNIDNDNFLRAGKILIIPARFIQQDSNVSSYTVKSGDTLSHIARRFNISLTKLRNMNPPLAEARNILPGQRVIVPTLGF